MRVNQTQRSTVQRSGPGRRGPQAAGGGFQFTQTAQAGRRAPVRPAAATANIDAIIALQSVDESPSRRRRAVSQGREVLDLLDQVKIALLSGRLPPDKLAALTAIVERYERYDGEPGLDDVLQQIDLRARVELAKLKKSAA